MVKNIVKSIAVILGLILSACAPASKPEVSEPAPIKYDFKCTATDSNGVIYNYRYYKHVVDATAYNMGMRNFIMVEVQIDSWTNSIDINEDGNTLELQKMYQEKQIYVNTIRGAYMVKTNYATNGGTDSGIIVELLGVPVVLTSMTCE